MSLLSGSAALLVDLDELLRRPSPSRREYQAQNTAFSLPHLSDEASILDLSFDAESLRVDASPPRFDAAEQGATFSRQTSRSSSSQPAPARHLPIAYNDDRAGPGAFVAGPRRRTISQAMPKSSTPPMNARPGSRPPRAGSPSPGATDTPCASPQASAPLPRSAHSRARAKSTSVLQESSSATLTGQSKQPSVSKATGSARVKVLERPLRASARSSSQSSARRAVVAPRRTKKQRGKKQAAARVSSGSVPKALELPLSTSAKPKPLRRRAASTISATPARDAPTLPNESLMEVVTGLRGRVSRAEADVRRLRAERAGLARRFQAVMREARSEACMPSTVGVDSAADRGNRGRQTGTDAGGRQSVCDDAAADDDDDDDWVTEHDKLAKGDQTGQDSASIASSSASSTQSKRRIRAIRQQTISARLSQPRQSASVPATRHKPPRAPAGPQLRTRSKPRISNSSVRSRSHGRRSASALAVTRRSSLVAGRAASARDTDPPMRKGSRRGRSRSSDVDAGSLTSTTSQATTQPVADLRAVDALHLAESAELNLGAGTSAIEALESVRQLRKALVEAKRVKRGALKKLKTALSGARSSAKRASRAEAQLSVARKQRDALSAELRTTKAKLNKATNRMSAKQKAGTAAAEEMARLRAQLERSRVRESAAVKQCGVESAGRKRAEADAESLRREAAALSALARPRSQAGRVHMQAEALEAAESPQRGVAPAPDASQTVSGPPPPQHHPAIPAEDTNASSATLRESAHERIRQSKESAPGPHGTVSEDADSIPHAGTTTGLFHSSLGRIQSVIKPSQRLGAIKPALASSERQMTESKCPSADLLGTAVWHRLDQSHRRPIPHTPHKQTSTDQTSDCASRDSTDVSVSGTLASGTGHAITVGPSHRHTAAASAARAIQLGANAAAATNITESDGPLARPLTFTGDTPMRDRLERVRSMYKRVYGHSGARKRTHQDGDASL